MIRFRRLLALILSFAILATGQLMASARGQVVAGVPVEICSVDGLVTVTLDTEGRPVGPAHLCPDLVLGFFADAGLPVLLQEHAASTIRLVWMAEEMASQPRPVPHPGARGPPVSV